MSGATQSGIGAKPRAVSTGQTGRARTSDWILPTGTRGMIRPCLYGKRFQEFLGGCFFSLSRFLAHERSSCRLSGTRPELRSVPVVSRLQRRGHWFHRCGAAFAGRHTNTSAALRRQEIRDGPDSCQCLHSRCAPACRRCCLVPRQRRV